jgi:homoserine dehydrogenase
MKELRIGLAGLGVVGKGVYDILQKDAALISKKTQTNIRIVAAASRTKKDFLDPSIRFYENILDLASDAEVDVIVEVIGGKTIAKDLFLAAIKNGKKIVTANKALLAEDGFEIAQLVEENNSYIGFEASTVAANPLIKSFKESFVSSDIKEFYGILNGTCNFILCKMHDEKRPYAEILSEAQELGYAEADPTFDIKGMDAAHKLALLSAIASSTKPEFDKIYKQGVDEVDLEDIEFAQELGYRVKLLGIYRQLEGETQQSVYPALIKSSEKLALVDDSYNALLTLGSNMDHNFMVGRGAGGLTTGAAVVSDLIDIARGSDNTSLFNVKTADLADAKITDISDRIGKYFLRLTLNKELSKQDDLSERLFAGKIQIEQAHMINREEEILCGFITSEIKEKDLVNILSHLDKDLVKAVKFLRVEETNF